jgi:hypothetical protein
MDKNNLKSYLKAVDYKSDFNVDCRKYTEKQIMIMIHRVLYALIPKASIKDIFIFVQGKISSDNFVFPFKINILD